MPVSAGRRSAGWSARVGLATALFFLAGCSTAPGTTEFPDLTYGHLTPVRVAAGAVDVIDGYVSPLTEPNVEHLFPLRPAAALQRWAQDRLQVTGTNDLILRFEVVEASAIESEITEEGGFLRRLFTTAHTVRYDLTLGARVEVRPNRSSPPVGFVRATATQTATLSEDATINEREQLWFTMLSNAMSDLNGELEGQMRLTLSAWLVN